MEVLKTSPINKEVQPYLHAWDTEARKQFSYFESAKLKAALNIFELKTPFFG